MKFKITYMRFKGIYWLVLFNIAFLTLSCTNPNTDAPSSGSVHTKSWNNPELLGSNDFHGTKTSQDGSDACRLCHGKHLNGSGDIPGCFDCHFGPDGSQAPSGSGWIHGQNPHDAYESYQNVCNACHEIRRQFNLDPQPCHDCHGPGTNHALGQAWLDNNSPQFHGNEPTDACSDCHEVITFCAACHFDASGSKSPLGSGWDHGDNDDHKNFKDVADVCNQCHSLNRSYGNEPAACHDCHDEGLTHVLGQDWLDKKSPQFHGNEPTDSCSDCHDLNPDCNECHFGVSGSKSPLGSGWDHGDNEDHEDYENHKNVCNRCHKLNRSFQNDPESCHDCHDD